MTIATSVESFVDVARLDVSLPRRHVEVAVGGRQFLLETLDNIDAAVALSFAARRREKRAQAASEAASIVTHPNELAPHFGVVWPAAVQLAQWWSAVVVDGKISAQHLQGFVAHDIRVQSSLELGCGLGVPSLLLAHLGVSSVLATDRHPLAGAVLRRNAEDNSCCVEFCELDWRRMVADPTRIPSSVSDRDLIIGSDLLYEPWQPSYLATALAQVTRPGALVVITDAGRRYFSEFVRSLADAGFRTRLLCLDEFFGGASILRILLAMRR